MLVFAHECGYYDLPGIAVGLVYKKTEPTMGPDNNNIVALYHLPVFTVYDCSGGRSLDRAYIHVIFSIYFLFNILNGNLNINENITFVGGDNNINQWDSDVSTVITTHVFLIILLRSCLRETLLPRDR